MKKQDILILCVIAMMTCVVVAIALCGRAAKEKKQIAEPVEVETPVVEQTVAVSDAAPQQEEVQAEEPTKEDAKEIVDDFTTPDLALWELKGHVRTVKETHKANQTDRYTETYKFNKKGKRIANKLQSLIRNKHGQIIKVKQKKLYPTEEKDEEGRTYYFITEHQYSYTYKNGRLATSRYEDIMDGWFDIVTTYHYSPDGRLAYCLVEARDGVVFSSSKITRTYVSHDAHGNWTKCIEKEVGKWWEADDTGRYKEKRIITRKITYWE